MAVKAVGCERAPTLRLIKRRERLKLRWMPLGQRMQIAIQQAAVIQFGFKIGMPVISPLRVEHSQVVIKMCING